MSEPSKTVLVTGASAGFGEAIARRFVAEGHQVIASARRQDRLAALADELGRRLLPIELDIRDRMGIAQTLSDLPDGFAEIDVLVNNAGLALGTQPAQEADLDDWEQMLDTNCKGLVTCTRWVLPGMVDRGRGHVVNIGSIAGSYPYPGGNVYAATKAFVHQFSLSLRSDVHGSGVRVTCIEPGMAETEFSVVRLGGDQERADQIYEGMNPLRAEDIAESVYWVTSQPEHVNVNTLEVMPTTQSFAFFQVDRPAR